MATSASKTGARRKASSSKKSPKRRATPVVPKAVVGRAKVRRKAAKKIQPKNAEYVPKTDWGRAILAEKEAAEARGEKLLTADEIADLMLDIRGARE